MTSISQQKQNKLIQLKLSQILQKQDILVSGANITRVEVTKNLERVKIFFSLLDKQKQKEVENKLNSLSYFFRKKLAQSLSIRKTPEIYFEYDSKNDYCFRMNQELSALGTKKN